MPWRSKSPCGPITYGRGCSSSQTSWSRSCRFRPISYMHRIHRSRWSRHRPSLPSRTGPGYRFGRRPWLASLDTWLSETVESHGYEHGCFVCSAATSRLFSWSTEVGFVHLHDARQHILLLTFLHGPANLVQQEPTGFVGDVQFARECQYGDSSFIMSLTKKSPEPHR